MTISGANVGTVGIEIDTVYRIALGHAPYPYQRALAETAQQNHWPDLVQIPTGLGKTAAIVLAWLYQHASRCAADIPAYRRLVWCLPMRVLVEQTADLAEKWIHSLHLAGVLQTRIPVYRLLGGQSCDDWDACPEQPAVLVGTQDQLLSRALNRGYGMSQYRWPMNFSLLHNDCLWIFDEVQLMGAGLPTSAQLDAFRQRFGIFFPCHSVWCSATLQPGWLATVDFAPRVAALRAHSLTTDDATMPAVQQRLQAGKRLQKCSYTPERKIAETELATAILAAHKPATRTLVVCNTVKSARALFAALQKRKPATPLLLLHSRFRPPDRQRHLDTLLAPPPESGLIAVATQVIEAGVDVSAATLFTELAPWASMVQRFGRCNRAGEFSSAQVFWVDMDTTKEKNCLPYSVNELEAARRILHDLDDVGPSSLPEAHDAPPLTQVLRAPDMVELFDTTPDMTGAETDVSRYIRESSERDVHVFWRPAPENGNPPAPTAPAPQRDELCAVSIHELRPFLKGKKAWRWDYGDGQWQEQTAYDPLYPGMVLWLPASSGGYTEEQGFIATGKKSVPPILLTAATPAEYNDADTGGEWQSLHDHALQCKQVMGELLRQLCPASTESLHQWEADLLAAALYHDWGKAHSVYQTALGEPPSATVWAKGPSLSRYTRKGFRHELASALALLQAGQSDLTAYLAAAHHGKVRLSIRSTPQESPAPQGKRFARGVHDGDELPPVMLDTPLPRTVLSLACMELGRSATGASWLERMVRLRDAADLGIFRLAYLETLVRVADWRASATGTTSAAGTTSATGTADPQTEEVKHA